MVDQLDPFATYAALTNTPDSALVDVRTHAEWSFTGLPDISDTGRPFWCVEWVSFPTMAPNNRFIEELSAFAGGQLPRHLFFICRSGHRSLSAAELVKRQTESAGKPVRCVNVAEGFEGDLDQRQQRGTINGWKARGLPWGQG